jgi:hypothetical protein
MDASARYAHAETLRRLNRLRDRQGAKVAIYDFQLLDCRSVGSDSSAGQPLRSIGWTQ